MVVDERVDVVESGPGAAVAGRRSAGSSVCAPSAARTVSQVLQRRQVPHLADCDPMTGQVIRSSKTTAVRYERERPGELVHMDVKKLGRIPDGGGVGGGGSFAVRHEGGCSAADDIVRQGVGVALTDALVDGVLQTVVTAAPTRDCQTRLSRAYDPLRHARAPLRGRTAEEVHCALVELIGTLPGHLRGSLT